MYTNMKLLATFMGAEVKDEFREEVRMFSSPHIETGRFAYDLIAGEMLFIPSNHVHNYIFNNLFDVRKLFVHSRDLENALARYRTTEETSVQYERTARSALSDLNTIQKIYLLR